VAASACTAALGTLALARVDLVVGLHRPVHIDRVLLFTMLSVAACWLGALVRCHDVAPAHGAIRQEPRTTRASQAAACGLTARELEILRLLGAGCSYREVAERLIISPGTARAHGAALLRKASVHDRASLLVWAIERGLIEDPRAPGLPAGGEGTSQR